MSGRVMQVMLDRVKTDIAALEHFQLRAHSEKCEAVFG